jgi:hypothetical protein
MVDLTFVGAGAGGGGPPAGEPAAGDEPVAGHVTATEAHEFLTGDGSWVQADQLVVDDTVVTSDGSTVTVAAVHHRSTFARVHNLSVDTDHTYYVLAGAASVLVHNCDLPAGFAGRDDYNAFVGSLDEGLVGVGLGGTRAAFQGSSVTGVRFRDGTPFNANSDYDVALGGEQIFALAKEAGIALRGGASRTGPLKKADLEALGLTNLRAHLSGIAGRDVNFMIYRDIDDAIRRSPSLPATGCGC